ncbi:hypothetical protein [Breoghania sp.]|uniref:hypothetical protein n=1 Tax=Breoghania sp. TaxID=2065378 RepID=UPI002608C76A|nr:hypothetical protein [Breoghania sp.]MDJ0931221.1 hypothetical protein [Breoghania sp.]
MHFTNPSASSPSWEGNTGFQMGVWYKREIKSASDLKGLKIHMPGFGGEVMRRLGATPVSLPPSEILTALQSGVIDATEFLGPSSDLAMGFHQVTKLYYAPGWHESNGTGEALVNAAALARLPEDLRAIVVHAIRAENALGLAEGEWMNAYQLRTLTEEHGVKLKQFPEDALLAEFEDKGGVDAEVYRSFKAACAIMQPWSRTNEVLFLNARV